MSTDAIRYDLRVQEALRGVVRTVLIETAKDGLPGGHHFYITFRTDAPGVRVSSALREKYPAEMTIVLQHHFWGLKVNDHGFEVGLSFANIPETLVVPFAAVAGFWDPSVNFILQFEPDTTSPAVSAEPDSAVPRAARDMHRTAVRGQASEPKVAEPARRKPALAVADGSPAKPTKESPAAKDKKEKVEQGEGVKVISLDSFRRKT